MLELLFSFVFKLITELANLLLSPFVSAISLLFPNVNQYFTYIISFLTTCLEYVPFLIDLLLIPRGALLLLFDYILIKYSIYLLKISVNFVINIYNKFKP